MKENGYQEKILQSLLRKEGQWVSGEHIAKNLSLSRTAVWKGVKLLQKTGFAIATSTKRGYALQKNQPLVIADKVNALLNFAGVDCAVRTVQTVDSTNTEMKRLAEHGEKKDCCLVAYTQQNGRGRLGRSFYSKGNGLYFSLLLHPGKNFSYCRNITTAVAVSVCKAVDRVTGKRAGIKWVNDVYLQGKKVCGILTESTLSAESGVAEWVVVGVGINLTTPKGGFPAEIKEIAGALDCSCDASDLLADIITDFYRDYRRLEEKNSLGEYRDRCFLLGKEVKVFGNGEPFCAEAVAIDDEFALVVRTEDGNEVSLTSGEVSVRLAEDV